MLLISQLQAQTMLDVSSFTERLISNDSILLKSL